MTKLHYVCDRCGHYWRAGDAEACPECAHDAIWEFPAERGTDARNHARHVERGFNSGLFREARA
jgi:predicted  nucleic acid-binding Zn-ribbon protein